MKINLANFTFTDRPVTLAESGEPLMGELKYISFAIVMASTILFSTVIGVLTGEWKGTGAKTRACLTLGTLILVISFCAISLGSK